MKNAARWFGGNWLSYRIWWKLSYWNSQYEIRANSRLCKISIHSNLDQFVYSNSFSYPLFQSKVCLCLVMCWQTISTHYFWIRNRKTLRARNIDKHSFKLHTHIHTNTWAECASGFVSCRDILAKKKCRVRVSSNSPALSARNMCSTRIIPTHRHIANIHLRPERVTNISYWLNDRVIGHTEARDSYWSHTQTHTPRSAQSSHRMWYLFKQPRHERVSNTCVIYSIYVVYSLLAVRFMWVCLCVCSCVIHYMIDHFYRSCVYNTSL